MSKEDKPRRFRNLAIVSKARVRDLVESFRRNFKSKRDSTTTLRSFLCVAAILGILPVTALQSQTPADECQDVQKHIKKEQAASKALPRSGSMKCY
jgi:hypothetical protein